MKTCGIVAEFNPFHNGHARLVKEARASGFDRVIAVMSGNFVQRGEPAVFETSMRVAAALAGGVDAVIQLPVNYALSGAENFARGAVGILGKTGAVDSLVFGSECAECRRIVRVDLLRLAAPGVAREEGERVAADRGSRLPHVQVPLRRGKVAPDMQCFLVFHA